LSREVERLIRENRLAWNHFERLPKGARLDYIHWVMEAKREETRARRAREVITLLTEGKRIGLK
ncbi:MAG TPA: YdeI/OmpD-associated family protein, partial [Methanomassiliicoccales archaeon]|nr:YdeI/OmpD-associated family protein [Methanomassiliicoccales archaeon]